MRLEKSVKLFLKRGVSGIWLPIATFKDKTSQSSYRRVHRFRQALLAISLLIIAAVVIFALRGKNRKDTTLLKDIQPPPGEANIEARDVFYTSVDKHNVKQWDLHGKSIQFFKDKKKVFFQDLELDLYQDNGKVYHLTGKMGELDTESNNITIQGDIKGTAPDKTTFATDRLFYDHARRILTTDAKVVIKQEKFAMEGMGMIIDLEKEKLSLLYDVKALSNR